MESCLANAAVFGVASDEVNLARDLVSGKNKDDGLFICEGLWAADKLVGSGFIIEQFVFCNAALAGLTEADLRRAERVARVAKKVCSVSQKAVEKISDRDGVDEFFIIARAKKWTLADIKNKFGGQKEVMAIVMDGLEQPGNIGAILRSFDSAGGDFAIIVNRKARLNGSRLVRASLGASFMLPVVETTIAEAQTWLEENDFRPIVTDLQATKNYREIDYHGRIAIVAGNEHTGISPSWRKVKNAQSIIIPMLGSVESLNVGFASTLVAYEAGLTKFKNIKY